MTDERLGLDLSRWMKDTEFAPPDSQTSARQVAMRLPQTRQLARRWWLRSNTRTHAHPPSSDQTSDYQAIPIQAANGHTPIVIGRTQSMLSPVKAIAAGALVFAIGGVLLIAQPFDQPGTVPGAATDDESMRPALVSGFLSWPEDSLPIDQLESYEKTTQDGNVREHWVDTSNIVEMDDPRLSGALTIEMTTDRFVGPDTDLAWATVRIENEAGSWDGRSVATSDRRALNREVAYYELVGGGAYEGLSAVVFQTEAPDDEWLWSGVIFPGDLPPNR